LKDLETKVTELSKAQEADKQENSLLKAQVERLTTELREYRKRLSLTNGVGRSPPLSAMNSQQRSSSGSSYGSNFQFDFPKFGALPGSQMFGSTGLSPVIKQDSTSPPSLQTQSRASNSLSPKENQIATPVTDSPSQYVNNSMPFAPYSTNNNMHGFASTLPQMTGGSDPFGDLFSPSILKNANNPDYFKDTPQSAPSTNYNIDNGGDSTAGLNRVFQFNGGSNASDSTSPSASSQSQWNVNGTGNSSCGTSPEPSHDSPAIKDKQANSFSQKQYQGNANAGNFNANSMQSGGMNSIDYSVPSLGTFDPVLFGDYRESNNAIVGGGDFTGGFFDDALNSTPFDFASPSNLFGILQSPQQSNASLNYNQRTPKETAPSAALMAEIEKARDGGDDDYGLPPQQQAAPSKGSSGQLISCNNIWYEAALSTDHSQDPTLTKSTGPSSNQTLTSSQASSTSKVSALNSAPKRSVPSLASWLTKSTWRKLYGSWAQKMSMAFHSRHRRALCLRTTLGKNIVNCPIPDGDANTHVGKKC
jgi:AP-1-like factor